MRTANPTINRWLLPLLFWLSAALLATTAPARDRFTIAVIPDTQNYVDIRHHRYRNSAIGWRRQKSHLI
jgi:hypothetical protein